MHYCLLIKSKHKRVWTVKLVIVTCEQLRQSLDALLSQLKDLPARLRTYPSYEHVKSVITSYTKVNMLVIELKSEAVKERHWKQLMRRLHVSWVLPDLTLGQLWDIDLLRNEGVIKDVLLVAQGEMALEEFLKQVRLSAEVIVDSMYCVYLL